MEVNKMSSYYYKEYRSMSETRLLTSIDEARTLRIVCTNCGAVQELPVLNFQMPMSCFSCGLSVPKDIQHAGEHIIKAMKLNQDASSSKIKLQLITKISNFNLHDEEK